tara:strand:- start:155 stop:436 length:282 start_codon:yes stop_codon:yes gene_type:complete
MFKKMTTSKMINVNPEKHISLTYSDYECFLDVEKFNEREWYREMCKFNKKNSIYKRFLKLENKFDKDIDKKRAIFVLQFGKSLTPKQLHTSCI